MKKIISLMLALLMAVILVAGCSATDSTAATEDTEAETGTASDGGDLLAEITERGKIVVAMEGTWAPWTYVDENNELVGFDVEVAREVATRIGVEVEFVTGEWDGLLAGVQVGRYDMMCNGVGYTEERAEAYAFSDPYAFNKTALVVRGDNEEIKSLSDLAGKTTCNSANSTYQLAAEDYGATVLDVETLDGTMEMVLSGRADATLNAEVSIYDYLAQQPDANIKIVDYLPDVERVCIIMPKGDSSNSLVAAVNQALSDMRADGTLAALSEKYFGCDITVE